MMDVLHCLASVKIAQSSKRYCINTSCQRGGITAERTLEYSVFQL